MPVSLYMDVHVPQAVTDQLRSRGVNVLTANEDGCNLLADEDLLERARVLGRVLVTQDIRFKALAEDWQRQGRPFAGLVFAHQLQNTIGQMVRDLELLATACDPDERLNTIEHLPF
jgi:hypothetical protein